jgi:hypothetical protein
MTRVTRGMPSQFRLPKLSRLTGRPAPTVAPLVYQSITPPRAVLIPSVVTIELSRNRAISTPLSRPRSIATTIARGMAADIGQWKFATAPATNSDDTPVTAPTDRSM